MSEEATPTITNPEKPVKVKDPKRVEAGKKLAAISKAAKERKARARIEKEMEKERKTGGNFDWKLPIAGAVALGLVAYVCLTKEKESTPPQPPSPKRQQEPQKSEKRNFDQFGE